MVHYDKRINVFLSAIPENVPDNNLERTVISVLSNIDVQVEPRDIEACHRIGKPTSKTKEATVRFVNRKNCEKVLANKKSFWSWAMKNRTSMLELMSLSMRT